VGRQTGKRIIERNEILGRGLHQRFSGFQRDALLVSATLGPLLAPGILNENTPHRLGRRSEEVSAAIPVLVGAIVPRQAQISLVNQRRRLKRLSWRLVGEPLRRQPAQLLVDQRQQLVRGFWIAVREGGQKVGYVVHSLTRGVQELPPKT
jgi:hypothetical protein